MKTNSSLPFEVSNYYANKMAKFVGSDGLKKAEPILRKIAKEKGVNINLSGEIGRSHPPVFSLIIDISKTVPKAKTLAGKLKNGFVEFFAPSRTGRLNVNYAETGQAGICNKEIVTKAENLIENLFKK